MDPVGPSAGLDCDQTRLWLAVGCDDDFLTTRRPLQELRELCLGSSHVRDHAPTVATRDHMGKWVYRPRPVSGTLVVGRGIGFGYRAAGIYPLRLI